MHFFFVVVVVFSWNFALNPGFGGGVWNDEVRDLIIPNELDANCECGLGGLVHHKLVESFVFEKEKKSIF